MRLRIYFFISFLIFSQKAHADSCSDYIVNNTCTKIKIVREKYNFLESVIRLGLICELEAQEVDTGTKWRKMLLTFCPNIGEGKEVLAYAKYVCNLSLYDKNRSKIYVMTPEECEPILALREKVKNEFSKIKPGISMYEFEKLGFTDKMAGGNEWQYSYPPAFVVKVKVSGEKCGDMPYCMDTKIQKFEKIIQIQDFNLNGKILD